VGGCSPNLNTTVMEIFSTITSPVLSELVIVHSGKLATALHHDVTLFETLRQMNEVRPFKLVFSLEIPNPYLVVPLQKLVEALDLATAKGLLDFLDSPPTIR
jgi:hypothetical protein